MHCGYSPLFTSGLLQDRDPSTYYFTLQPRHTLDLRSFLPLGLADPRTKKSGLKRTPSATSRSTGWTFCTHDRPPRRHSALAPPSPPIALPLPPHGSFRRTSRESMRTLPSPKPVPSTTLPAPPVQPPASRTAPPSPRRSRAPPFLVPSQKKKHSFSTSHLSVLSPTKPSSSHRASCSAPHSELDPALLSPCSPRSPIFTVHARSLSSAARSDSITSSAKGRSRMDALACLEGRGRRRYRRLRGNFMSWSDDEDDQASEPCSPKEHRNPDICVEDVGALGDVEDEDESDGVVVVSPDDAAAVPVLGAVPIPQSSQRNVRRKRSWKRLSVSPARSAPPSSRASLSPAVPLSHPSVSVLMLSATAGPTSSTTGGSRLAAAATSRPQFISASAPSPRERQRRSTIDSWFALRSFIDLRADSDERTTAARSPSSSRSPSWNWRSFIEIGA
ncbi:hypothetical protein SCLCIDRAFT_1219673 [Scleroderma citrinum Foug A]|uniref:Uncharacterized protein n=1 Tax=Scleroderma citrinum Foug A TaxID=1036808 RepID=A0A0C3DLU2_9AGAM|nr:hypothetical protein SCLCIDRAFT_1219673 [Scleroderma citrinum Foug A]